MPQLLKRMKELGFKIVHLAAKEFVITLPRYDERVGKNLKVSGNMAQPPISGVVETVKEN